MKLEKVVVREEQVIEWKCDVCGKQAKYTCQMCRADLCKEHCVETDGYAHDMTYPHFDGDYPSLRICERCWKDGEPERVKITELNASHEKEVESLLRAWHDKSQKRNP